MVNVDKEDSLSVENIIEEPLLATVVVWATVVLDEAKLVVFVLGWGVVGPRVVVELLLCGNLVVVLEIGSVCS